MLVGWLQELGHEVDDLGTHGHESVDYPDFGARIARSIEDGEAERGIAVCGSGIGISIAVNREPACRCARVDDPLSAQLAREHNDANVLAFGARLIGQRHGQGLRLAPSSTRPSPADATSAASTFFQRVCRNPIDGRRWNSRRRTMPFRAASSPRGLSEKDPSVEAAIEAELHREQTADRADRVREYRQPRGARGAGLGADQQICGRLSGPALLPGLRAVGPGRDTGDRAGQAIVRLRLRQRPAAFAARRPMAR